MAQDGILVENLQKQYKTGTHVVYALRNLSFSLPAGKFITLMGPSGSGKSTLMHILAGIDRADSGKIHVLGEDISKLNEKEITNYRRYTVGIIFQFFNLLPYLDAIENVSLPLYLSGMGKKEAHQKAKLALESVELKERTQHKPSELSGGEQQRVAIARAIVANPKFLLADEPTGNLDTENSKKIMELLLKLQSSLKFTFLMVTHDPNIGKLGEIQLKMKDGSLEI
jgi:putative ABC transport system ATP-binding protein/lipoprotein-releasing system ATP-binding protein